MPKFVADDVIMRVEGDVSKLEKLLGLNPGDLGKNPVRVDIENPHNIRICRYKDDLIKENFYNIKLEEEERKRIQEKDFTFILNKVMIKKISKNFFNILKEDEI